MADAQLSDLTADQDRLWSSLNQPPYTSFRHSSKIAKPEKGTLEWLVQEKDTVSDLQEDENIPSGNLRMEDFVSWRDSNQSKGLVISAPPGSGKPVLSNFIVEHLESRASAKPSLSTKVIYYFCNIKNDEASRNATSVLRALIMQLCEHQQRLFRILPQSYEKDSNHFFTASFDMLWYTFEKMLRQGIYARIYCIIDGLDVYRKGMDELITKSDEIFNLGLEAKRPVLKLLCTTRPQKSILDLMKTSKQTILRCSLHDLNIFIESRVENLRVTADMKQIIKDQLLQKDEKSFLWLEVVIRRIETLDILTERKIKKTIVTSSLDLDELYREMIQCLLQKDEDRDKARLLACVVYAYRPLTLRALQDAMAIDPKEKYIEYKQCQQDKSCLTSSEFYSIFGTLLDVAEDKVYCIHQSVKDYFERRNPLKDSLNIEPRLLLAHVSMVYLSLKDFEHSWPDEWKPSKNFPFFEYAARYWYSHIESAADFDCHAPLGTFLKELVSPTALKARNWITVDDHWKRSTKLSRISQVAIQFDIGWLAEILLDKRLHAIEDDFEEGCLSQAVERGAVVFEVLLKHRRCVDFAITSATAQKVAGYFPHTRMELLLDRRGVDVPITGAVVQAAAGNWQSGKEVMSLLLDRRGPEIQITEEVVQAAAGNSESGKEVMSLLLDRRGVDVPITEAVVQAAAGNWQSGKEVMSLLLDRRGPEIQITEAVVQAAAGNWRSGKEVMSLLLDRRGVDVPITEAVVQAAARNLWSGNEVMSLLLDRRGPEIQITEAVVESIAQSFDQEVMSLLLDRRGPDIEITEAVVQAAAGNRRSGNE
ncbi:MAG: hypothetical protein Q9194_006317, partial [Teloschistes cf. exilis]